jgi:hypothetical protein
MLHAETVAALLPPSAPLVDRVPVSSSAYRGVVVNTLFHPSRNPDMPPAPQIEKPAPPRLMPALPAFHGAMHLGFGLVALLAFGNRPSQTVRIGDAIGPFRLVDFNMVDITFEFEGMLIRRTLEQLTDHSVTAAAVVEARDSARSAVEPAPAAPVIPTLLGPGPMTAQGVALCLPNDSTPFGTIRNGLRKVQIPTPFATACVWEPVGRTAGGRL